MKTALHRGETIKGAIKNSGMAIGNVAEKLNVSRKTLYNKFKEPSIPYSFILRLGEVIHHDFSQEFPNLKASIKKEVKPLPSLNTNLTLSFDEIQQEKPEKLETPKLTTTKEYEEELISLQRKYITLLEKFNELLLKQSK